MVIASKVLVTAHCLTTQPVAAAFFGMTVATVFSNGYATPKSLMDVKHIPPIIVSMVRDGALYYFLYVTTHILPISYGVCYSLTARMFGVFISYEVYN